MTTHFHELRLRLSDCRASLRSAKDVEKVALAEATQRVQPQGKNAEERSVNLTLALQQDQDYLAALAQLRRSEYEVERIEALLESALDDRRASEWQIRARLADALFRARVQADGRDAVESAFDDTSLEYADAVAFAQQSGYRESDDPTYADVDMPF